MRFVRKQRHPPTINIINLIDILVVLLIFYIATTVFKKSEPKIKIVVPSSTHARTTTEAKTPSIIYVTEDSKIYLDDTLIDPAKLADLLKSKLAADPSFKVAMKADKKAPFGAIVQVMDAAHTANISDLPTFTTPEAAPGSGGDTGGSGSTGGTSSP